MTSKIRSHKIFNTSW